MASRNVVITVIVVASFGLLGVGFLRLLRSTELRSTQLSPTHSHSTLLWSTAPQLCSDVACVALALAGVCGSLAAITGHLVVPRLIEHANAANNSDQAKRADQAIVDIVIANDSITSGALMQTSFAAWAVGAVCLSISMLHNSTGWKVLGACGIVLGLCILSALALGRLQMSLHSIGLTVLGSGIWIIALGLGLCANKSFAELRPQP